MFICTCVPTNTPGHTRGGACAQTGTQIQLTPARERPQTQTHQHTLQSLGSTPASLTAFLKMRKRKSNDSWATAAPHGYFSSPV